MTIRTLFGISVAALLGLLLTQPSHAYTVPDSLVNTVRYYYESNKNKSPAYGCNWFRVLIAYGDKEAGHWPGGGSCTLVPYTAAEAKTSEYQWNGWTPIRESLEKIEAAPPPPPPPPRNLNLNRYHPILRCQSLSSRAADKQ